MKIFGLIMLVLIGCASSADEPASATSSAVRRRDAGTPPADAAPTADAALGSSPGVVSCYSSSKPTGSCVLSTGNLCCFDNFVTPHNGSCTTPASCVKSDEACDGSEDCAAGEQCFASEWRDTLDAIHWSMACAVTAPTVSHGGAVFGTQVMCHPGGAACPTGTCMQANPTAGIYDFPTTLYICH